MAAPSETSVVLPVWNGRGWLEECLRALREQTVAPLEVIAVDNGSTDGSLELLRGRPDLRVLALPLNTGFAYAVNRGIAAARGAYVATLNTDVLLAPDWLERVEAALVAHPGAAAVASKMVDLRDPSRLYDAGDVLRRDGACEQRGRFGRDDGRYDTPGWVFGACAGAALYRRDAVLAVGGFDERYFAYLEDVELALRLQLAGWRCRYEPAVARHAGEGSSHRLPGGARRLVARNTLLLVATWFPARWLLLVAYRQAAWLLEAARTGTLGSHLRGLRQGLRLAIPVALRRWRGSAGADRARLEQVVPAMPIRGPSALGHPAQRAR